MSVIVQGEYVTLTDGATVATDASLGELFYLAGFRSSRTMSNPTNPTTGQSITYLIQNTGGLADTSWGTAFLLAGPGTDAASDRARAIAFFYNGTSWIETTRTGWDLKLISFDPADVASLVGWWEAEDVDLADSASVTTWPARYGHDLVAPSGNEPTYKTAIQNGRNIVRFDGTDDYLSVASPLVGQTACSVFAVFAKSEIASTSLRGLVDISGTGNQGAVFFENDSSANKVSVGYGTGSGTSSMSASSVGTAFHQWSLTLPSAGIPNLYKDAGGAIAGSLTSSLSFTQTTLYVGSNTATLRFMNGDLAELILYSTVLGNTDRTSIATYLKQKWGTP